MLAKLTRRFRDWCLERRIRFLTKQCLAAIYRHDTAAAYLYDQRRLDAIRSRSPAQVARMERKMNLARRRVVKDI